MVNLLFLSQSIWMFAIYSFFGWLLEILYQRQVYHKWQDRGFLYGPFCPIYGFGILFVANFLSSLQHNYLLLFIGAVLITSILEYLTGFFLELLFHTQWWNYSDKKFNIGGKVCLEFSLYWGFLSIIVLKYIHPQVINLAQFLTSKLTSISGLILLIYFLTDFVITINSLYSLKHLLEALNNLKGQYETDLSNIRNKLTNPQKLKKDFKLKQKYLLNQLKKHHLSLIKSYSGLKSSRYKIINNLRLQIKSKF